MESGNSGYKSIIKSTTLFGGVKFIQAFLNLLRVKIIAIILGPTGVGFNGLYQSTISIISNITGLGLNFSAVRDISKANESGDIEELSRRIKIFRRWQIITVGLGFLVVVIFSGILSKLTFNTPQYAVAFIFLSLMLVFNSLADSNASLLQGTRSLSGYAKHTLTGTIVSLIVSAPLFYFFGLKGIVPALIVSALITWFFSIWYSSKIKRVPVKVGIKEVMEKGGGMVKLGVAMMLTTTLTSLANYLINIYIKSQGSVADFGLYQAGMSITAQSIGLIFVSMAIDYYPKLAAISEDNGKVRNMVNQQAEVMLLVASPILLVLMIAAPLAVKVFLSNEFLPIVQFIRIISVAFVFKSASYSIGAISFAKGDKKTFFFLEGIYTNSSILFFSVAGYYLGGLNGLGYGFVLLHAIYLILILFVNKKRYDYTPSAYLLKILFFNIIGAFLVFGLLQIESPLLAIALSIIVLIAVSIYSLINIGKVIDLQELLRKVLPKGGK